MTNAHKMIALQLIFLIIIMPFAFAVDVKVYGSDKIEGYRRASLDNIYVEMLIESESEVAVSQVRTVTTAEEIPFQSCRKQEGNWYNCTFSGEMVELPSRTSPYLYRAAYLGNQYSRQIWVDDLGPEVIINSVLQDSNNITISYNVKDRNCLDCIEGYCSGIKKLSFYAGNDKLGEMSFDGRSCNYANTSTFTLTKSGNLAFTVEAEDHLGNTNLGNLTKDFDVAPPVINSYKLIRGTDEVKALSSTRPILVNVVVEIDEQEISHIKGDLSALNDNPGVAATLVDRTASCGRKDPGKYECTFENIYVMSSSENLQIHITAADLLSNSASKTLSKQFTLDTDNPKITFVGTKASFEDKSFIHNGKNIIKILIQESGIGFNQYYQFGSGIGKSVIIDLRELGLGKVAMADCNLTAPSLWECNGEVNLVNLPHKSVKKMIVDPINSRDDVGNPVEGTLSGNVIVDNLPPKLNNLLMIQHEGYKFFKMGDTLSMEAEVEDDSYVMAFADLSVFTTDAKIVATVCEPKEDNKHICTWNNIGQVNVGPRRDVPVKFTFVDLPGNYIEHIEKREILFEQNVTMNYWNLNSIKAMPKTIDPQSLSVLPLRQFFELDLVPVDDNIIPLKMDITCEGDDLSRFVQGKPSILGMTSRNPYIKFDLTRRTVPKNQTNMSFNCQLTLLSRYSSGSNLYLTQPEQENFTLDVFFNRNPLGALPAGARQKIEDAKGDYTDVSKYTKILDIAKKICGLIQSLGQIEDIINKIALVWKPAEKPAQGFHKGRGGLMNKLNRFCEYVWCQKTLWENPMQNAFTHKVKGEDGKTTRQPNRFMGQAMTLPNPSSSLYSSIMAGCIPGIIYNLEKKNEIACQFVYCMEKQVPQGTPIEACEATRDYLECQFTTGQIFNMLPFQQMFQRIFGQIHALLKDPMNLLMGISNYFCEGEIGGMCRIMNRLKDFTYAANAIKELGDVKNLFTLADDKESYCDKVNMD